MKQLTIARRGLSDDTIRDIVRIAEIAYAAIKSNPAIAHANLSEPVALLETIAYIRHIWGETKRPDDLSAFWDTVKQDNVSIVPDAYKVNEP
jgi:hypothetical protein